MLPSQHPEWALNCLAQILAVTAPLVGVLNGDIAIAAETFTSAGRTHDITVYPGPGDGKKYPIVLVLHGNAGFNPPFGPQILSFAQTLAGRGYVTAAPQYYADDEPHLTDANPHPKVQTIIDAIERLADRSDVDAGRLGLVGYSLGAAIGMTYIASNSGKVKVLVVFLGLLTPLSKPELRISPRRLSSTIRMMRS